MNNHDPEDSTWMFAMLARISNTHDDAQAADDARRRIADFFDAHLKS